MPDEQPVPPQPIPSQINNHRGAWVFAISILVTILATLLFYHFFLTRPSIDPGSAAAQDVVKLIDADALLFHKLWNRWQVIDWLLTFLATGTAVAAVIKNNYSVKSQANDLAFLDKFLIVMAVFAVLATTFEGKLQPSRLEAQYRCGDLILQKAEMAYAGSDKSQAARGTLQDSWLQAENCLSNPDPSAPTPAAPPVPKPANPSGNQPGTANSAPTAPPK